MQTLFSVILLASSIGIIASVFFQEGEDSMGALGGQSSDSLFGKNKSNTPNARLQRVTAISGIIFMFSTLVLVAIQVI